MTSLDRHIERLQAMRAAGNGSSDFATDLLDVLDVLADYKDEEPARETLDTIREHVKGVPTLRGRPGVDERVEWLASEMDELKEFVDASDWDSIKPAVVDLVDFRADLLVLLVEAGIAEPNEMPDDPLSLLRMFLPVE